MPSNSDFQQATFDAVDNTSVTANGKQAAPAANTPIATTANLGPGSWDVECTTMIGGTTVANVEVDNMVFKIGATPIATILNAVAGTAGASDLGKFKIRVDLNAQAPISIASGGAAATAASIYTASIVANKVMEDVG